MMKLEKLPAPHHPHGLPVSAPPCGIMNLYNIGIPTDEAFAVREIEDKILIFRQHPTVKWDNANKVFRSSVWDKTSGELISAGFRAFLNYGEQPEFEPLNLGERLEYRLKLDGSSLIVSKFKGELIVRTRGTTDAESTMENGDELPILRQKYPSAFDNVWINTENCSFIYEWYSPRNVICLREAPEAEIWLLAIVKHEDYRYVDQETTDKIAAEIGVKRPDVFKFNTFVEMKDAVEKFEGKEGVVIYSQDSNTLKKVKGLKYLAVHKIKSQLNSDNSIIDLYVSYGMPSYQDFYSKIETDFDFELARQLMPEISKVVDAGKEVVRIMNGMENFVNDIRNFTTRKEQALAITNSYGGENNNRASFCFCILDGKSLSNDQIVKLFWQIMKES